MSDLRNRNRRRWGIIYSPMIGALKPMKRWKEIREYIEEHKSEIKYVSVGMYEDWSYTADCIYDNGEYLFDLTEDFVEIAGINGSYWATPIMKVHYLDGTLREIACYKGD